MSQWGHDFRPEYRSIGRARRALGDVQTLAFTATADKATREDVAERLFEGRPRVFLHSFDRPNIALRFEPKDQPRRQLAEFVAGHKGESGIVYCASRLRTESLAENLGRRGVRALAYHAGMDQSARSRNQDAFLQEDGVVMVATVAFGMGINKPDVRFVCHADMPSNVESYYQEIGRAGRDGLPADTLTLYGFDDMALRRRQIAEKDIADERRQSETRKLEAMIALCEAATCRRQALLAYFGEESPADCGHCDLCRGGVPLTDATVDAQKALSAVARTGGRFGAGYITDILVGRETEVIRRNGHASLKTFGVGQDKSQRVWRSVLRQLFAAGALDETGGDYPGLRLTEKGEAILFGRERVRLRAEPERRLRREAPGTRPARRRRRRRPHACRRAAVPAPARGARRDRPRRGRRRLHGLPRPQPHRDGPPAPARPHGAAPRAWRRRPQDRRLRPRVRQRGAAVPGALAPPRRSGGGGPCEAWWRGNHARGGLVPGATGPIHIRHRPCSRTGSLTVCNSPSEYLDSREAIAAYIDAALEDATQPSSSIRSVSWLARSA